MKSSHYKAIPVLQLLGPPSVIHYPLIRTLKKVRISDSASVIQGFFTFQVPLLATFRRVNGFPFCWEHQHLGQARQGGCSSRGPRNHCWSWPRCDISDTSMDQSPENRYLWQTLSCSHSRWCNPRASRTTCLMCSDRCEVDHLNALELVTFFTCYSVNLINKD